MLEFKKCYDSEDAVKEYNNMLNLIAKYINDAKINRDAKLSISEINCRKKEIYEIFNKKTCFKILNQAIDQVYDLYTEELEYEVERMRSNE